MNKMILAALAPAFAAGLLATPANAATFADTVISFSGGNGSGVYDQSGGSYLGAVGSGVFDSLAVTTLDGAVWALGGATGTAGAIQLFFSTGSVIDGAGLDLFAYDTFGLDEGLNVSASADGVNFFSLTSHVGTFASCSPGTPCSNGFDLAGSGLASARYFKLTAAQGSCVFGYPECYDLDALEGRNFQRAGSAVPEPATWAMMLAGFGMAGAAMRRRQNVRVSFV